MDDVKKQHPLYFLLSYSYTPQFLYFTLGFTTITFQSPKGQVFVFKELLFFYRCMAIKGVSQKIAKVSTGQNSTDQRLDKPTALTRVTDLESL